MRTDADDLARVRDPAIELLLSHASRRWDYLVNTVWRGR